MLFDSDEWPYRLFFLNGTWRSVISRISEATSVPLGDRQLIEMHETLGEHRSSLGISSTNRDIVSGDELGFPRPTDTEIRRLVLGIAVRGSISRIN